MPRLCQLMFVLVTPLFCRAQTPPLTLPVGGLKAGATVIFSGEMTRGVEPFTVRDEHYQLVFDGSPAEVFLHSRSEHGVQPAGWTRNADGSRVCVLTPGHELTVWLHPEFQKLLLNALRWTAKLK